MNGQNLDRPQFERNSGWPECDGRNLRRTIMRNATGGLIIAQAFGLFSVLTFARYKVNALPAAGASLYLDWLLPGLCIVAVIGGLLVLGGRPVLGGGLSLACAFAALGGGGIFMFPGAAIALMVAAPSHPRHVRSAG